MEAIKTQHPYVVKIKGVRDGKPVIKDTRIPVWIIAGWLKRGYSPELIQKEIYPHLTLAQIYDALSYYYDNQDEIDRQLKENNPSEAELARRALQWKNLSSL